MLKNKPLISIIMPAFNAGGTIGQSLKSLCNQTYNNIEIVVVDDGSIDDTIAVAKKIEDARITIIRQKNLGAAMARNAGLKKSHGDFVMFCDADDSFDNEMVKKMLKAIDGSMAEMVVCGKKVAGKNILPRYSGAIKVSDCHILKSVLCGVDLYSPCDKIYNSSIIKQYKLCFPAGVDFGEDLIFNLSFLKHSKNIFYLKEPLYNYNLSSYGNSFRSSMQWENRQAMAKTLRFSLKKHSLHNDFLIYLIKIRWFLSVSKSKIKVWLWKK